MRLRPCTKMRTTSGSGSFPVKFNHQCPHNQSPFQGLCRLFFLTEPLCPTPNSEVHFRCLESGAAVLHNRKSRMRFNPGPALWETGLSTFAVRPIPRQRSRMFDPEFTMSTIDVRTNGRGPATRQAGGGTPSSLRVAIQLIWWQKPFPRFGY